MITELKAGSAGHASVLDELKAMKIWMIFRNTPRCNKVPSDPVDGTWGLSWTNPANLRTYDEVTRIQDRFHAEGIGFVIPLGFAVADLDHCLDASGLLKPVAQRLVAEWGSYAEKSPSGKGLHIIARPGLPAGISRFEYAIEGQRIEIKTPELNYATFTGNAITDSDIVDCTPEFMELYKKYGKHDSGKPVKDSGNNGSDANDPGSGPHSRKQRLAQTSARTSNASIAIDSKPGHNCGYGLTALSRECDRLRATAEGKRTYTTYGCAVRIGELIPEGHVSEAEAFRKLVEAGAQTGLDEAKVEDEVHRGLEAGKRKPRPVKCSPKFPKLTFGRS